MWYRRNFTVPEEWRHERQGSAHAERVMLRFGAVDWEAEVFVNGIRMGLHRGGWGPLCTSALVLLKQFQTHQSPSDPAHRAWWYSSPHSVPGVSVACYEVRSASIELGVLCRYDKFAFDITDALEKGVNGVHEVAVRVFDPTG